MLSFVFHLRDISKGVQQKAEMMLIKDKNLLEQIFSFLLN
jgi:hypothetical protein